MRSVAGYAFEVCLCCLCFFFYDNVNIDECVLTLTGRRSGVWRTSPGGWSWGNCTHNRFSYHCSDRQDQKPILFTTETLLLLSHSTVEKVPCKNACSAKRVRKAKKYLSLCISRNKENILPFTSALFLRSVCLFLYGFFVWCWSLLW